mgnify:CR=1 FL=1
MFDDFVNHLANNIVYNLLLHAQETGSIKKEINLNIFVKIYFYRIDNLVFKEDNLFKIYSEEELFKHLVIYNLKGIIAKNYSNLYFE